jgi:hypothetical protein
MTVCAEADGKAANRANAQVNIDEIIVVSRSFVVRPKAPERRGPVCGRSLECTEETRVSNIRQLGDVVLYERSRRAQC